MKSLLESWNRYINEDEDIDMVSKVMIIDGDSFLSLLRPKDAKYKPDHWDFPGGHLKKGETHEQAAKREVKEEIGLDVDNLQKIGEKDGRMYVVFYKTDNYSGEISLDTDENQEYKWIKLSEVDNYNNIIPSVLNLVKREIENEQTTA